MAKINYQGLRATIDTYPLNSFEDMKRREFSSFEFDHTFCIMQHDDGWYSTYLVWPSKIALVSTLSPISWNDPQIPVDFSESIGECWSFCEVNLAGAQNMDRYYSDYVYRLYGRDFSHHRLGMFHPKEFAWINYVPYGEWEFPWNQVMKISSVTWLLTDQRNHKLDKECLV